MDWDDKLFHYILVGFGLLAGSFLKYLWDRVMSLFWDRELKVWKNFWKGKK